MSSMDDIFGKPKAKEKEKQKQKEQPPKEPKVQVFNVKDTDYTTQLTAEEKAIIDAYDNYQRSHDPNYKPTQHVPREQPPRRGMEKLQLILSFLAAILVMLLSSILVNDVPHDDLAAWTFIASATSLTLSIILTIRCVGAKR